jgi:hypothetical protein
MPWGLVVLGAFSLVVYRRARDANRRPFAWVLLLWGSLLVGGGLGASAGGVLHGIGIDEITVPVGGVCGMLVTMVVVARAAGRPIESTAEPPSSLRGQRIVSVEWSDLVSPSPRAGEGGERSPPEADERAG